MATVRRTAFALKGQHFAIDFQSTVGRHSLGPYRVAVLPASESTSGGAQASQPIVLKSDAGPTLTIGSVNVATEQLKLRDFACVKELYARRAGDAEPFGVDEADYQGMMDRVQTFASDKQVALEIETELPELKPMSERNTDAAGGGQSRQMIIGLAIACAIAAAYVALKG